MPTDITIELIAQVAGLRREVKELQRSQDALHRLLSGEKRKTVGPADAAMLEALLPIIAATYGHDIVFTVQDLFKYAEAAPSLNAALKCFGDIHKDGARRVGFVFRRAAAAGFAHGALRLCRCGTVKQGALWEVRRELVGIKSR